MRNNIGKYAATLGWPVLVTTLILLAWEISVRILGIRSIILPPPSAVLETMAQHLDVLFTHFMASPFLPVLGLVVALIDRLCLVVFFAFSPNPLEWLFSPTLGPP